MHIVLFLGPLYVIVEFAPHGNLRDFLKENRPPEFAAEAPPLNGQQTRPARELSKKNLISFADQIARGMQYLSENKVIINSSQNWHPTYEFIVVL